MKIRYIVAAATLGLALAACSGGTTSTGPQEITVNASDFKFEPATIQVTSARPVKVIFQNNGSVEHDWSIMKIPVMDKKESAGGHTMSGMMEEPAVHVAALNGQKGQLEFTPTAPGTYEFWCTVPGHKEAGMVGKLVVQSP